eukprot:932913_1
MSIAKRHAFIMGLWKEHQKLTESKIWLPLKYIIHPKLHHKLCHTIKHLFFQSATYMNLQSLADNFSDNDQLFCDILLQNPSAIPSFIFLKINRQTKDTHINRQSIYVALNHKSNKEHSHPTTKDFKSILDQITTENERLWFPTKEVSDFIINEEKAQHQKQIDDLEAQKQSLDAVQDEMKRLVAKRDEAVSGQVNAHDQLFENPPGTHSIDAVNHFIAEYQRNSLKEETLTAKIKALHAKIEGITQKQKIIQCELLTKSIPSCHSPLRTLAFDLEEHTAYVVISKYKDNVIRGTSIIRSTTNNKIATYNKKVIIKYPPRQDRIDKLIREFEIVKLLKNTDGTTKLHQQHLIHGIHNNRSYPMIVMQESPGLSLTSLLNHKYNFTNHGALSIIKRLLSIAQNIFVCHRLLHLDISSNNLIINIYDDNKLQLIDWETAIVLKEGTNTQVIEYTVGTPTYTAPEVAMGIVSVQSELFAVGSVLCNLLFGKPMMTGRYTTKNEFEAAKRNFFSSVIKQMDETGLNALHPLVMKMTQYKPLRRGSFLSNIQAIDAVLNQL